MKFIEIDRGNHQRKEPLTPSSLPRDAIYIPSGPSVLSSISANVVTTLEKLSRADIDKIAGNLHTSLDAIAKLLTSEQASTTLAHLSSASARLDHVSSEIDRQLGENRVADTLDEYRQAASRFNAFLDNHEATFVSTLGEFKAAATRMREVLDATDKRLAEARLGETSTELRQTLQGVRASLQNVDTTLDRYAELAAASRQTVAASKVPETTESIRNMMAEGTSATRNLRELQREAMLSLDKLNRTLAAVEEWVEYLDQDPSALVRGKSSPATK